MQVKNEPSILQQSSYLDRFRSQEDYWNDADNESFGTTISLQAW